MQDYETINKIYKKFRDTMGISRYDTMTNVGNRFVKWLNEGEKPKGFKDVKGVPRKKRNRDLNKDDMLNWDDGILLSKAAKSIQISAIIPTQLDGGFRPSEFTDINYGDIKQDGKFMIVHIKHGKTGSRDVILYKSVPFLKRWLDRHPTKKDKDPLWVMEYPGKNHKQIHGIQKYSYPAMLKRVRQTTVKLKFKKPLDFYNLRHSACYISKLENTPTDLAAEKFGHTVSFYIETYARLDAKDKVNRFKLHNREGKVEEEVKDTKPILCTVCENVNEPGTETCEKCQSPLSLKTALDKEQAMKDMQSKIDLLMEVLAKDKKIEAGK